MKHILIQPSAHCAMCVLFQINYQGQGLIHSLPCVHCTGVDSLFARTVPDPLIDICSTAECELYCQQIARVIEIKRLQKMF